MMKQNEKPLHLPTITLRLAFHTNIVALGLFCVQVERINRTLVRKRELRRNSPPDARSLISRTLHHFSCLQWSRPVSNQELPSSPPPVWVICTSVHKKAGKGSHFRRSSSTHIFVLAKGIGCSLHKKYSEIRVQPLLTDFRINPGPCSQNVSSIRGLLQLET